MPPIPNDLMRRIDLNLLLGNGICSVELLDVESNRVWDLSRRLDQ
jgi:hypothetical protein